MLMVTLLGFIADRTVQETKARVLESKAAFAESKEAQAACQGENAALQDTVKLQASEISAVRNAKEDATARTADFEAQLESLQASLQAARQQGERERMELQELQNSVQQAQVCFRGPPAHYASHKGLKHARHCRSEGSYS